MADGLISIDDIFLCTIDQMDQYGGAFDVAQETCAEAVAFMRLRSALECRPERNVHLSCPDQRRPRLGCKVVNG